MRSVRLLTFVAPVVAALACNDATSPASHAGLQIRDPRDALVIPSTTPQISAGYNHTCALKTDGTVVCWGRNDYGQTTVPLGLASIAQVSAGGYHTCALKTDGTVACWGRNEGGQATVPEGLASVAQVSAGGHNTCALKTDATAVCWGRAINPPIPGGLVSLAQISAGGAHTCALKTDGTVVCGGDFMDYAQTTVPSGLASVAQVSAGGFHTCALKTNGTVVCWGASPFPGNNYPGTDWCDGFFYDELDFSVPFCAEPMPGGQLSAGFNHDCALRTTGTVACWGRNYYGEATVPSGLASVAQVSAGNNYTCALKTDGTVVCWGLNDYGQATVPDGFTVNAPSNNTSVGSDVSVTPVDATTGSPSPIDLTFSEVITGGTTTVTSSTIDDPESPPPPGGFQLGSPATIYNITTTASFTGQVTLCISYAGISYGNESDLKLLHYDNGAWTDITSAGYPNTLTKEICGLTSSFSPFMIAQRIPTPLERIAALQTTITSLNMAKGTTTSLNAKLRAAQVAVEAGTTAAACTALNDLTREIRAQSGKKITVSVAALLTEATIKIQVALGC